MPSSDLMHRFLFDQADLRGEMVTLSDSYEQILENNQGLPPQVQTLLGEFVAAAALLSSTLKFDGILTLQARGDGPLSLIMAECSHHQAVRAIAQVDPEVDFSALAGQDLQALMGQGMLAIIIDPDKGQRYQGIVPLDSPDLSGCLQHYFEQSEQLPTRFWLTSDDKAATGLMLQALPQQTASADDNRDLWETATQLASTVKKEELLELEHSEVLYRLFHEEQVRLFEPAAVRFECSCSWQRSANALISLGREDVEALLAEQDLISIDCQFCNQTYAFGAQDLAKIFGDESRQLH
ncbi:Hsp33 family molecular chaperone HslO [Aestuariicella hydrocarbonica]|uniref:33 kDa chaperonin n=1 Tax=Pseudomaricurvus hydrocarbonicus TaxID=1470433 RepID=A0A9E5MNP9_9GAMM|nr:Hsp33 family molecular chaperone HslO [Aestuariicella hydrocarbonica]NHO67646.1 Hsp33 family molecular chaperone HslO [Aestuariicella hydrocarbonica]